MKIKLKTFTMIKGRQCNPGDIIEINNNTANDLKYRGRAEVFQQKIIQTKNNLNKTTKKIAIVGSALSTKNDAPFNDKSWQIYSLNYITGIQRFDLWFDIHNIKKMWRDHPYWHFLVENQDKLIIAEPIEELPNASIYPQKEIMAEFGDFFTNTISWMIAFAIHKNVEELAFYGVDMANDTEYAYQKPSVLYLLGIATGKGIKINIPEKSRIFEGTIFDFNHKQLDQRLMTLYYLGVAVGQGIKLNIPDENMLFHKEFLYWLI